MSGAGRGEGQVGDAGPPLEVAVVETAGGGAVEGDRANAGVGVEEGGDFVRHLGADCRVGAGGALGEAAHVPEGETRGLGEGEARVVIGHRAVAEEGEDDRPEKVARVGIILLPAQRLLARERPEYERDGAAVDDRRKAALGRGAQAQDQPTKRPSRTAVWPLSSRRDGMIRMHSS